MKRQKHSIDGTAAVVMCMGLAFFVSWGSARAAVIDNLVAYYDFNSAGAAGLVNQAPGATGGDAAWVGSAENGSTGFAGAVAFNPGDGVSDRSSLLVGNALNVVDSDNAFINVPFGTSELGATFTISAWTYLAPGAANTSPRFQAFESDNSYDVSWGTDGSYSTNGRNDYDAYVETTNIPFDNQFAEEEWDHVLMIYDTSGANPTVSIYLNGSATAVTGTDTSGTFSFNSLHFGDYRTGLDDRDWDGMIDEVGLWDRALATDEIAQVYDLGLTGRALTFAAPEPSSALLILLGTGLLTACRRRGAGSNIPHQTALTTAARKTI